MKIFPDKLDASVRQSLLPLYLVSGEETLLIDEAADIIRKGSRNKGFMERETFDASLPGFRWEDVLSSLNSLSLFAEKKLVEIRCSKKHLNEGAFLSYWDHHNPDVVVMIITEKLDKTAQKGKWFTVLEKIGAFIPIWPLDTSAFQRWLSQRARAQGLQLEPQAVALLQARTEGNLLAAVQELEKLYLLFGNSPVDASTLAEAVANNARYDVFGLANSVLAGNDVDSLKILHNLLEESGAGFSILRNLIRELHILAGAQEAMDAGKAASTALQRNGVWEKRQPLYLSALKRLDRRQIEQALQLAQQADLAVMGLVKKNVADALEILCLALCGKTVLQRPLRCIG